MIFKEGQTVEIKNPRSLTGIVVRERPGDRDLPEEQRHIVVRIETCERFYKPEDLAPLEQSRQTHATFSPEWNQELQRFINAGHRWMADSTDRSAWEEFVDAGRRIGWIVPFSAKTE